MQSVPVVPERIGVAIPVARVLGVALMPWGLLAGYAALRDAHLQRGRHLRKERPAKSDDFPKNHHLSHRQGRPKHVKKPNISTLLTLAATLAFSVQGQAEDVTPAEARAIAKEAALDGSWKAPKAQMEK